MSRSAPVLPYRVLPSGAARISEAGWTVVVANEIVAVLSDGSAFGAWDAKLEFELQREIDIAVSISDVVGTIGQTLCELVVTASTGNGALRRVVFRQRLEADRPSRIPIAFRPASELLAKDLTLTVGIYLSSDADARDALAPTGPGNLLWEQTDRIRLEGGAARLPIYEVPFSKAFPAERMDRAEFHIELADDPDIELEAGITVYVNSECPDFVAELNRGGHAEARLWGGVFRRSLVSAALSFDGQVVHGDHPAGTLGGTLTRWMRQIWPDARLDQLRSFVTDDYPRFEAQIESWLSGMRARQATGADQ